MLWNSIKLLWNTQANSAFCVVWCTLVKKKKRILQKFKWSHVMETLSKNTVKRKHANSVNLLAMKSGGCKTRTLWKCLDNFSLWLSKNKEHLQLIDYSYIVQLLWEKSACFSTQFLSLKSSCSRSVSFHRVDFCPPDSVFSTFACQSHHCDWLNKLFFVLFFY